MPRSFSIASAPVDDTPVQWVKWFDSVKAEGDLFTIHATSVSFKDEAGVFYLIGDVEGVDLDEGFTQQGTSVFVQHHPASKFTDSVPDSLRLASAFGRYLDIEGDIDADEMMTQVSAALPLVICVERKEKGRLWTVSV